MSIRGKLVAFIIGTVALIQLAWGLSVVRSDAKLMEHEAARKSRAILHAIAAPVALHMATREFEAIDAVLEVYAKRSTGRNGGRNGKATSTPLIQTNGPQDVRFESV